MIGVILGSSLATYAVIALCLVMVGNLAYSLYLREKVKKQIEGDRARLEAYEKSVEASFVALLEAIELTGSSYLLTTVCPKCRQSGRTKTVAMAIGFLNEHSSHGGQVKVKALITPNLIPPRMGQPERN